MGGRADITSFISPHYLHAARMLSMYLSFERLSS